jgi:cardiolipin synthase
MATRRERRSKQTNGYSVHNKVKIVRGGADYFHFIEEIAANARYSLHLQTYIFDENDTGNRVADALINAAKRNVYVYVLLDGYASKNLSAPFIARLRDAGVHLEFFRPLVLSNVFYLGRRLHHKVIVADADVCMVAGINISDRYNDIGTEHAWLDWAIHAEGDVARQLNDVCIRIWNRSSLREKCKATDPPTVLPPAEECLVRIRRNDWVYQHTQITRSYRELFNASHHHVTLMTSYFWPPFKLLKRMAAASRRGVKISLVLTARADVPFAKYSERYLYPWLFRHNIDIYEYEKNILHGKVATRDNEWLTAGSYNVNNISAFASVELNLDINNATLATELNEKIQTIIREDCTKITPTSFVASSNLVKRLGYYLSYRVTHIIFYLFTFYFTQRRERN